MSNLENRIVTNINSLIMMLRSKGIEQLSATKFLLFVNKEYDIQLDQNALEEILSKNGSVKEIVDDKIIIGEPSQEDEETVDDSIHDMAVDQAADNISMESVDFNGLYKLYEGIKVGDEINPRNIVLESDDINYHLNNGAKKAKSTYIVTDILPSSNINESKVRCKIKGQCLFIDIPITSIK